MHLWRLVSSLLIFATPPAIAAGPGWPRFQGGPLGNGQAAVAGPQTGKLKWSRPIHGWAGSAAVDAAGVIYVGSSTSAVTAVNPDGTTKWQYRFPSTAAPADLRPGEPAEWLELKQGGSTASHSPVLGADGSVYVGLSFHPNAVPEDGKPGLYALSRSGTLKWVLGADDSVNSSPNISPTGDLLFTTAKWLYCAKPDGSLRWKFPRGGGVKWSSPAIDSAGNTYVVTEGLTCVGPDGKERWQYVPAAGPLTGFAGHPILAADGTVYFAVASSLYAVSATGAELWTKNIGWTESAPGVGSDGRLYIGTGRTKGRPGRFLALEAITGALIWEFPLKNAVDSSPVIGSDGLVYVGTDDGYFYAFTPAGQVKWKLDIGTTPGRLGEIDTSAAFGPDGTLYFGHHGGRGDSQGRLNFYAISPD